MVGIAITVAVTVTATATATTNETLAMILKWLPRGSI